MRVAPGIHVGVDPDGHAGDTPQPGGDRFDPSQLARRLDVDRLDVEGDRALELRRRLADPGEDELPRLETRGPGDVDFPDRVGIRGAAEFTQQTHDRERRIGLERVVNRVRVGAERSVDLSIALSNERRAVDVQRRAFLLGDRHERNAITGELACGR